MSPLQLDDITLTFSDMGVVSYRFPPAICTAGLGRTVELLVLCG